MNIHASENTIVTMGVAHQADAFQGGREAAQSAKRQLPDGPNDLVLAFGRGDFHFQDFIEGVRLVTGEETLVGFPSTQVISNNLLSSEVSVVCLMQAAQCKVSVASYTKNGKSNAAAISSLLSQLKQKHGNQKKLFKHRYLLFMDNLEENQKEIPAQAARFEAGLLTEMVAIKPPDLKNVPLMSQDKLVFQGFVAVEFLSNKPWGVGAINIGEFKNQKGVHSEAAKTILRRALGQMEAKPSCGIFLANFPLENFSTKEWRSVFQVTEELAPNVPVVGVSTGSVYIHQLEQPIHTHNDALAVLLLP